ncbi:DNA replication licensing factor mcm10 [Podospora aff. communis PSN243]|uniref:DNA replication licensing factor mcm10 n=1 Tax=Podospora aff. communis PSN243 TaxID=3040156 RepID=A0AAV9H023_9PEZI|nr:DNA replication licensing factor mcm10 [Podospora aff. communis PSN243]
MTSDMASQWPPRSPHEALLGTPSGREQLRRLAERTSPSPSPAKLRTSRSTSALGSKNPFEDQMDDDDDDDEDDEDEDEEILKLQLQAIEAKLKLKKLKAAKAQKKAAASASDDRGHGSRSESSPGDTGLKELPIQSKIAAARDRIERQNGQAPSIQVPASPVKRANSAANVNTSPQRVVLGIDKGLRAADVSLKRAPSYRKSQEDRPLQEGGYLRRTKTPLPGQNPEEEVRPMSFNERLASARSEEASRAEKQQRIKNIRSSAFSVGKEEMEEYKTKAADIPYQPYKAQEYTRSDVLSATGRINGGQLPRSNTAPGIRSQPPLGAGLLDGGSTAADSTTSNGGADSEASFEPYSGLHLSKRILPHKVLTRAIRGMTTYLIKDLLKHVKAPDWSLPDVESDIVVFAIIASKSDPRSHKPGPGGDGKAQKDRGKYMVVTLVDLQFELELYLFNSGFERFWKLSPGTVLAILNPSIIPPPPGREATGRFGIVINSDADTILEIGNARDIGYCKSVKKDGSMCSTWINVRRTEYCEYHTNEAIRKTRAGRIELNSTTGFGGGGVGPRSKHNEVFGFKKREKTEEELKRGNYDRFAHATYFVNGAHRAAMDDEREGGLADRAEREEGIKRKLQRQEKERDIAKRLGQIGGGAGKEYMSHAAARPSSKPTPSNSGLGSSVSSSSAVSASLSSRITNTSLSTAASTAEGSSVPPRWDARALGLVGKRGDDGPKISLAPVKRKRPESSASSSTATGSLSGSKSAAALGWGSTLGTKLARMKDGERLDGRKGSDFAAAAAADSSSASPAPLLTASRSSNRSPVRKKTRFVTEKGIREAGRESLGEPLSAAAKSRRQVILDDDDDDDLIIVK